MSSIGQTLPYLRRYIFLFGNNRNLDLTYSTFPTLNQGKTVEEIRMTFNIEDPKWTEEELENLKKENAWAYDIKK